MTWGIVSDGRGWSYQFTDADYEAAVRGVFGEIERWGRTWEAEAHLEAILHGLYLGRRSSYADFWRAYSSALRTDLPLTERRQLVRTMPLASFPAELRARVASWMRGMGDAEGHDLSQLRHFDRCGVDVHAETPDIEGPSGQCYWRAPRALPRLRWSSSGTIWPWVLGGVVLAAAAAYAIRRYT